EMAKPAPDEQKEIQGLAQGRNDPSDIPGMIALFRQFGHVSYISRAISDWTQGDVLMVQIQNLGTRLHADVIAGRPRSTLNRTLSEIGRVNQSLTVVEDHFSYTLGEGSRWLTGLVLKILLGAALVVELSGLFLTASITRGISKRLNAMLKATDRISRGDYRVALDANANDEIGHLSAALIDMAGEIQLEQSRAEHAVRVTEAALKEAQRVAHIGSWQWDAKTDVITWSKEFVRLCDAPSDERPHRYADFINLVHTDDRLNVDKAIQAARTSLEPFSVDYRIELPSGSTRWLCAQGVVECDAPFDGVRLV